MDPRRKTHKQIALDGDIDELIPDVYPVIDSDLARDNVENDISEIERPR